MIYIPLKNIEKFRNGWKNLLRNNDNEFYQKGVKDALKFFEEYLLDCLLNNTTCKKEI